jgi:SAM-dependent methyltransferase
MDEITKSDAVYHAAQKETWIEQNQMNTSRNITFHNEILNFISAKSNETCHILELGGGIGFDLKNILSSDIQFCNYVFSDISEQLVAYVKHHTKYDKVTYCCIDGQHIPFENNQFDFVFMIAALHHFPDFRNAVEEITRVTKEGGFIIFGIEPNRHFLKCVSKIKLIIRKVTPGKDHSPADEKAQGFTISDWNNLQNIPSLKLIRLEPVLFFCGFIHYGLELLFRIFCLKRRLRIPAFFEKAVVAFDQALSLLPGMAHIFLHYTVIYQKKCSK